MTRGGMIGFLRGSLSAFPSVRLETSRVYIRPPRARDWKQWAALREESRAFLTPWEPTWPRDALGRAAFARRLRRQVTEWRHDLAYSFFVFRREDDRLMGGLGLSNVRRGVAQMATLGYWMGEPYAAQGYMSEGVTALLSFAFRQIGLHRVEAACLPHNAASRRLLAKVGFTEEGLARAYLRIDGRWTDHVTHGILREDFLSVSRFPDTLARIDALPPSQRRQAAE